ERHEDAYAVALADPKLSQAAGQAADFGVELSVAEPPDLAWLAFPDDSGFFSSRAFQPAIQAARDDVHPGAAKPARPLEAVAGVDDPLVRLVKADAQVLDRCVPEPLQVAGRPLLQLLDIGDPVTVHEALEPAAVDDVLGRLPEDVTDHDRLHRLDSIESF